MTREDAVRAAREPTDMEAEAQAVVMERGAHEALGSSVMAADGGHDAGAGGGRSPLNRDPFVLILRVPTVEVGVSKSSEQTVITIPNSGNHSSAAGDKSESVLDETDTEDDSDD